MPEAEICGWGCVAEAMVGFWRDTLRGVVRSCAKGALFNLFTQTPLCFVGAVPGGSSFWLLVSAAMVLVLLAHAAPLGKSGNMNGDYLIATGTKMAPKFNNDVSDRP